MLPLMLAIKMMLPGMFKTSICLPAACAVKRTPFMLTSISYHEEGSTMGWSVQKNPNKLRTLRKSSAGYSRQSFSSNTPAFATQISSLPSRLTISSALLQMPA